MSDVIKKWLIITVEGEKHILSAHETVVDEGVLKGMAYATGHASQLWAFAPDTWASVFPAEEKPPIKLGVVPNKAD